MRSAFFILILFMQGAAAQSGFRTVSLYTTQSGLSNNTVYCVEQDTRGFLWLGTREGLSCFDGLRFKNFFSDKEPAAGLADNFVSDLLEFKPGQLLIATASGLSVLNTFTGNFENDKISFSPLRAGSGILIGSLFKDQSGKIWISHSGELDVLDNNLKYMYRFTDLPWASSLKGIALRAHSIVQDKQQRLWLPGDTSGIQIIDFVAEKIYNSRYNPNGYPFLKNWFTRTLLFDEANQCLWYGPWGRGLMKYNFKSGQTEQITFGITTTMGEERSVNVIHLTGSGKILCLSGSGFFEVDTGTQTFKRVEIQSVITAARKPEMIPYTLFRSNDGQYWLGSSGGLWQLKYEEPYIRQLNLQMNQSNGEQNINSGITSSPLGKLYLGYTYGGLVEMDQNRKDYRVYNPGGFAHTRISRVYADEEGQVWVGTTSGLLLFDPATKRFSVPDFLPAGLRTGYISSIFKNRDGTVWVGTRSPFSLWRRKKGIGPFEKLEKEALNKFRLLGINSRISEFIEDDRQNTWMISRLGGGILRCQNDEWHYFPVKKKNIALLAEKGFDYINNGKQDNLWLTDINGNGLLEYFYLKDSVVKYTRNEGLPSGIIRSVCSDGKDRLWIATDYGLSLFDMSARKVIATLYEIPVDGSLIHRLFYDKFSGSLVSVQNNQVIFLNEDSALSAAPAKPEPLIDGFFVNNVKTALSGSMIKLKAFQENITINFTAVQFIHADKIKFAYRLQGADHDWKQADAGRTANYARLSPGHYRFYLKATDVNGKWGPEYMLVSFSIAPPFWKTWWFLSGLGLLLLALLYVLYRYRIRQLIQLQKVRDRIATDLHDEIGTSLTNISLLSELTHKNLKQPVQAETFIQRINEEVNLSGQALDDIVWSINTRNDSLEQVAARMRRYAAEIFEGAGIAYSLDMDEQVGGRRLNMEQRRDLFLIFKELVNNIYKHAGANNVSMKLRMENSKLHFTFHDDGKGFEPDRISSGNGIKNIKQRIARWKGTVNIDTTTGGGTRTVFILPVEKHHTNE